MGQRRGPAASLGPSGHGPGGRGGGGHRLACGEARQARGAGGVREGRPVPRRPGAGPEGPPAHPLAGQVEMAGPGAGGGVPVRAGHGALPGRGGQPGGRIRRHPVRRRWGPSGRGGRGGCRRPAGRPLPARRRGRVRGRVLPARPRCPGAGAGTLRGLGGLAPRPGAGRGQHGRLRESPWGPGVREGEGREHGAHRPQGAAPAGVSGRRARP